MSLANHKNLLFYKSNKKKRIRYVRWIVKAAFLLLFVVPVAYVARSQELSVSSFFSVNPTGHIAQFSVIESLFTVPITQSPDSIWLSFYGNADPGVWIVEPFGGLQVLLTGQVNLALLVPTIVAVLIFVAFTVLLGNVFCSWACPIGTIIDSFDKGIERFFPKLEAKRAKRLKERVTKERENKKSLGCSVCPALRANGNLGKLIVVSSLVGSAVFRFPVFCTVCPIGIITRGLFHFKAMMSVTGVWMTWWLEMLFLPVAATLLSLREKRFFCKRICPVGSFLGGVGALNPLIKPQVNDERCIMKGCPEECKGSKLDICMQCRLMDDKICEKVCPVDIDLVNHGSLAKCTKCMECYIECPYDAISIKLGGKPEVLKLSTRLYNRVRKRSLNS